MKEEDRIKISNEKWLKRDYQKIIDAHIRCSRKINPNRQMSKQTMEEKWENGTA